MAELMGTIATMLEIRSEIRSKNKPLDSLARIHVLVDDWLRGEEERAHVEARSRRLHGRAHWHRGEGIGPCCVEPQVGSVAAMMETLEQVIALMPRDTEARFAFSRAAISDWFTHGEIHLARDGEGGARLMDPTKYTYREGGSR